MDASTYSVLSLVAGRYISLLSWNGLQRGLLRLLIIVLFYLTGWSRGGE